MPVKIKKQNFYLLPARQNKKKSESPFLLCKLQAQQRRQPGSEIGWCKLSKNCEEREGEVNIKKQCDGDISEWTNLILTNKIMDV